MGSLLAVACDEGGVRIGPRPKASGPPDGGRFQDPDELLRLMPGATTPSGQNAVVEGHDVRALLPKRPWEARAGDRIFAVVPIGQSWSRVGWRAGRLVSVTPDGRATVRLEEGRDVDGVPAVLIVTPSSDRPQVGEVVRAGIGRELPYARVAKVEDDKVVVRTVFLGAVREETLAPEEILRLPSRMALAAPVVFRLPVGWRVGCVIAAAHKHWWVLGSEGVIHLLPWTHVKALALGRTLGPGDTVRAALPMNLRTVTVTKVLEPGLRYEVGWDQTKREVVGFARLAPL